MTSSEVSNTSRFDNAGKQATKTNKIIEWIDAFITLNDLDIKYFALSIKERDKQQAKKYRSISDKYSQATNNLIKKLP